MGCRHEIEAISPDYEYHNWVTVGLPRHLRKLLFPDSFPAAGAVLMSVADRCGGAERAAPAPAEPGIRQPSLVEHRFDPAQDGSVL